MARFQLVQKPVALNAARTGRSRPLLRAGALDARASPVTMKKGRPGLVISAVCEPDPALARRKDRIPLRSAEIPDLTDLPSGCDFHPRCPLYTPGSCDTERPPLVRGPERLLACHVVNGQG